MRPQDRQNAILALIAHRGEVRVEELAARFSVSVETVRRDLAQLDARGMLRKVHGGARLPSLHAEDSYGDRLDARAAEKERIARHLAALVGSGETLFLDTGSTTLACARALSRHEGLTAVTNSVHVAQALAAGGRARVFLLGGLFAPGNVQTVGAMVLEDLSRFHADRAVLTVSGLHAGLGATDADCEEAQVARAMIARARQTVIVADSAKIGLVSAFSVCATEAIDVLVTEDGALAGPVIAAALAAGAGGMKEASAA